jgi:hypothetical protein
MASENIPRSDGAFNSFVTTFATVASANALPLGLSLPQVGAITAAATDFTAAYNASEASKATTKGLVAAKDSVRSSSEAVIRSFAKQFLANPDVSPALKGQLGLNVNPTPLGPVAVPTDLSATGFGNGTNQLKWKRNGNASGTIFTVEAKIGSATEFSLLSVTTTTKFSHMGQTPGTQVVYRVTAQRGGVVSGPSNEAVVYSNSEAEALNLELAA